MKAADDEAEAKRIEEEERVAAEAKAAEEKAAAEARATEAKRVEKEKAAEENAAAEAKAAEENAAAEARAAEAKRVEEEKAAAEAKAPAEAPAAAAAAINDSGPKQFYSMEELKNSIDGVDFATRELWLPDEEFQSAFGMSKDEFKALKQWKKVALKKKSGLW